jgi:hypothetical protein
MKSIAEKADGYISPLHGLFLNRMEYNRIRRGVFILSLTYLSRTIVNPT